MALQKNHNYHGAVLNDAYHKITYISGTQERVNVDVSVYESKEVADAKGKPADSFGFTMTPETQGANDVNWLKQAYKYMKTELSDYSAAIDV